jgi:hypothetical protein
LLFSCHVLFAVFLELMFYRTQSVFCFWMSVSIVALSVSPP